MFVMSAAYLSVLVVLFMLCGLLAVFDGLGCYLLCDIMCAWRFTWSCLGVCGRNSL